MPWESLLVLVVVATFVGASVGAAYARAQRQWSDYRTARDALPGMRKLAWSLTGTAGGRMVLVTLIVASLALYGYLT